MTATWAATAGYRDAPASPIVNTTADPATGLFHSRMSQAPPAQASRTPQWKWICAPRRPPLQQPTTGRRPPPGRASAIPARPATQLGSSILCGRNSTRDATRRHDPRTTNDDFDNVTVAAVRRWLESAGRKLGPLWLPLATGERARSRARPLRSSEPKCGQSAPSTTPAGPGRVGQF